jgi:H+/Cl- antiporter ClcA
MIHMAACIFYVIGQYFYSLKSPEDHRAWIVAGGAAGIAAAFNAPLAGVVFVLEELAQAHFHKFRTVVISAAIIGGIISQWLSGKYLYLGYPMIGSVPISSVPWAILIGSLCGLFAIPFHKMLSPQFQEAFKKRFNTRLSLSLFIGLSIATLAIFVSAGTVGGGTSVVEGLLFKGERASWNLILGRYAATFLSHLSGCSGGFLAPALALGAAIGSKLATVFNYPNHNLIVLVGMSSFLSAIIRAPFTGWVIVMEMTDRHSAIFPLMVGSMCAHGVVKYFVDREKPSIPAISS